MEDNGKFKQLDFKQRKTIEKLLKKGWLQKDIATRLGVNKSTISREISTHSRDGVYWADLAQIYHSRKRKKCHPKLKINNNKLVGHFCEEIKNGLSPETISGRLKLEIDLGLKTKADYIGYETIYKIIYESSFGQREELSQYLPRGKKHRTKQHGRKSKKTLIPNRVSIDDRPEIVNLRARLGDWEADSIIYPHKKALNSLVERKTLITRLSLLNQKTAAETKSAIINQLQNLPVKTITFDNGTENTLHQEVGQELAADTFFCHPYHSWEKGTNENTNGLVRRYLPRGKSIDDLTQQDIDEIAEELNNRPRKKLGYYTPNEMLELERYKLFSCI